MYQVCDDLKDSMKSGKLTPVVLIDIKYNGTCFTYGKGYEIINRMVPQKPSKSIINFITINQNNISNSTFTNSNENIANNLDQKTYGATINDIIGSDVEWEVKKLDDAYQLIPDTNRCCIDENLMHTEKPHGCIYVRKKSVVLNCFSHGKRVLKGPLSKSLREIFFIFSSSKGIINKILERILLQASADHLVRMNGNVLQRCSYGYITVSSYRQYLKKVLNNNAAMRENPRRLNDLLMYMEEIDDDKFPLVSGNKRYIGFSNGVLDTSRWRIG